MRRHCNCCWWTPHSSPDSTARNPSMRAPGFPVATSGCRPPMGPASHPFPTSGRQSIQLENTTGGRITSQHTAVSPLSIMEIPGGRQAAIYRDRPYDALPRRPTALPRDSESILSPVSARIEHAVSLEPCNLNSHVYDPIGVLRSRRVVEGRPLARCERMPLPLNGSRTHIRLGEVPHPDVMSVGRSVRDREGDIIFSEDVTGLKGGRHPSRGASGGTTGVHSPRRRGSA